MTTRLLILPAMLGIVQSLPGCSPPNGTISTRAEATRAEEKLKPESHNDPAGDLARLQGRWKRIPHGEGPAKWPESYLIIVGDQLTYDHKELREKGPPTQKAATEIWGLERFRFVLNSGSDPKVMRYSHMWKDGREIELPDDHPEWNKRYTVENGLLKIWTMWAERHEQPVYEYERVSVVSE